MNSPPAGGPKFSGRFFVEWVGEARRLEPMTPPPPFLAYAVPPLSILLLLLPAVWIFIVISSVLLVILPFAYLEGPALWRPILNSTASASDPLRPRHDVTHQSSGLEVRFFMDRSTHHPWPRSAHIQCAAHRKNPEVIRSARSSRRPEHSRLPHHDTTPLRTRSHPAGASPTRMNTAFTASVSRMGLSDKNAGPCA